MSSELSWDPLGSYLQVNTIFPHISQNQSLVLGIVYNLVDLEKQLLSMVRSVSEDKLYDTIEFNEFLQMMSRQEEEEINEEALADAFK